MGCGLTVNDVLRNHVEKTIQNNPGWFTPHQQRVLHRLADDGEYVTIRVKSYRKKCHETLRMTGEEFVKRFAFLVVRGSPDPALGLTAGLLLVPSDKPLASVFGGGGDLRSWTCGVGRPTHNSEIPERCPMRCPRCGHGTMASAGRYDRRHTLEFMREREVFWSRVYTVASTLEDLPFEYLHALPRPET